MRTLCLSLLTIGLLFLSCNKEDLENEKSVVNKEYMVESAFYDPADEFHPIYLWGVDSKLYYSQFYCYDYRYTYYPNGSMKQKIAEYNLGMSFGGVHQDICDYDPIDMNLSPQVNDDEIWKDGNLIEDKNYRYEYTTETTTSNINPNTEFGSRHIDIVDPNLQKKRVSKNLVSKVMGKTGEIIYEYTYEIDDLGRVLVIHINHPYTSSDLEIEENGELVILHKDAVAKGIIEYHYPHRDSE